MADLTDTSDIRETVRAKYAAAARAASGASTEAGCCGPGSVTCGPADAEGVFGAALYGGASSADIPEAAINASLGCGVPTAVADLAEGETVLDLGSGAGADVLISARRVGPTGKAIGLDMTDEMLELARANAAQAGVDNVEFLKGFLENMPLADETVDVVISNCVINLSGDKAQVIREAARVLRPGGRFAVSDVIADPDMDDVTRADMSAWTGCIAGALTEAEFRSALQNAGFAEIEIRETHRVHEHAGAAIVRARKPAPAISGVACTLDAAQRAAQLERYGTLGLHAAEVEHGPGRVVVRFFDDPPAGVLERTLEVERGCCPFFDIQYEPAGRRLVIAVEDPDHDRDLDALAHALTRSRTMDSLPMGGDSAAPAEVVKGKRGISRIAVRREGARSHFECRASQLESRITPFLDDPDGTRG
jgi:ubiquinone/menaquinone biosynthesis C-methylase UbiE